MNKSRAALSVALISIALLAGSTGIAGAAASRPASVPGDTTCERFRAFWGPHYTYPGLNCP